MADLFQLRDQFSQPVFGNNSLALTAVTRFLQPGFGTGIATTTTVEYRSPDRVTIWRNLRVHARLAGVGAQTLTFTLMVGGVATVLSAAGLVTLTDWTDSVNRVVVPASSLVGIRVTKSAAIGTSPTDIVASVEIFG